MTSLYGFLLFMAFMVGSAAATWYSIRSADKAFDRVGELP
jgi:hypothetical protein